MLARPSLARPSLAATGGVGAYGLNASRTERMDATCASILFSLKAISRATLPD